MVAGSPLEGAGSLAMVAWSPVVEAWSQLEEEALSPLVGAGSLAMVAWSLLMVMEARSPLEEEA